MPKYSFVFGDVSLVVEIDRDVDIEGMKSDQERQAIKALVMQKLGEIARDVEIGAFGLECECGQIWTEDLVCPACGRLICWDCACWFNEIPYCGRDTCFCVIELDSVVLG